MQYDDPMEQDKNRLTKTDYSFVESAKYLGLVYQIGFSMIFSTALFGFGGYWLDQWLGTKGVFFVVGLIVGAISGLYLIYREVMKVTEK